MSVGTWIIAGLLMGFLASKLVVRTDHGLLWDLGLSVVGAIAAGAIIRMLSTATDLTVLGVVVTTAGASAMLVAYHRFFPNVAEERVVARRRPTRRS